MRRLLHFPALGGNDRVDDVAQDLHRPTQGILWIPFLLRGRWHQPGYGPPVFDYSERFTGARYLVENGQTLGLELGCVDGAHLTSLYDQQDGVNRGAVGKRIGQCVMPARVDPAPLDLCPE